MVFRLIELDAAPQFRGCGLDHYFTTVHHIHSDYRILLVPFSYLVPLKRQSVWKSNECLGKKLKEPSVRPEMV
jgi:hypothetical protein